MLFLVRPHRLAAIGDGGADVFVYRTGPKLLRKSVWILQEIGGETQPTARGSSEG